MAMADIDYHKERRVLHGPYKFFDGSLIVEFLETDGIDATFLIRTTMTAGHPLVKKEKRHPLVPPLHVHFDQAESFKVLKGRWGITTGWDQKDTILTPEDLPFTVTKMVPHTPWPVTCEGESVVLVWGHPDGVEGPMDDLFFLQIFEITSMAFEGKKSFDLLQVLLSQHEVNSTAVIFPTFWFLGSLRWWIPWKLQGGIAMLARWLGYKPLLEKYLKMK